MVLAAGYGMRLRPLTDEQPKAALPVAGKPVVVRTLERLAASGCERAAVNLHHLGERLRALLGDVAGGMPLVFSPEEELRGTLGALAPLREFCSAADLLVVVNGDSLCRWPLPRLLRAHRRGGAAATLLLSRRADPAAFGGGVAVAGDGRIVSFRRAGDVAGGRRRVFAGVHVLSPALLEDLGEGPADFVDGLYEPLLAAGSRLLGVDTGRPWHDLGTPERYRRAVLDWVFGRRPWRRRWRGEGARIADSARLRRAVVESGAEIGPGARLSATVVLPGARVGRGTRLRGCLVGFDAAVPAGADIEGRLITPADGDETAGSRVGNLVFTPLAG